MFLFDFNRSELARCLRWDQVALDADFVSIILPHLDDFERLDHCLQLLMRQTIPKNRFEIIVADNGSQGGIEAVRRVAGDRAKVIAVDQRGAGPARNAGVAAARGSIIAFIDSDCSPDLKWLEKGLDGLKTADVVGGRMVVLVEDRDNMTPAEAFETVFAFRNKRYVDKVGFTVTASMFLRKEVFTEVGIFENFVPEDVEWCRRAKKSGYTIAYAEGAIIGHAARKTMDDLRRKWLRLTTESYNLIVKDRLSLVYWMLRSWAVLFSIVPHSVFLLFTDRLSSFKDRRNAALGLVQIRFFRFIIAHWLMLKKPVRVTKADDPGSL